MFKNILPGKRSPADNEFQILTPPPALPSAINGKENQRVASGASKPSRQPMFSDKYRGKKNVESGSNETNNQFDRLLVRSTWFEQSELSAH